MDVRFLKSISEAYVLDTELNMSSDAVFEEVYGLIKLLREYDIDLYNELYETSKLYQQKIIKRYLDEVYEYNDKTKQDEIISEELTLSIGIPYIIGAIIALLATGPVTKGVMKIASIVGGWFESFGSFVKKHGKYMQLRYSIIQENTRKCYVKCQIDDPKKLSAFTYFTITTRSKFGTKKSLEQGQCLRDCYIENLIDVIALHMESYFACLKRTGGFDAVNKAESDDLLKMISATNLGASCETFYNEAKKALDNFYATLDLVYNDKFDENLRLAAVDKLRRKIYEARQTIQRTDSRQLVRYTKQGDSPQQK